MGTTPAAEVVEAIFDEAGREPTTALVVPALRELFERGAWTPQEILATARRVPTEAAS